MESTNVANELDEIAGPDTSTNSSNEKTLKLLNKSELKDTIKKSVQKKVIKTNMILSKDFLSYIINNIRLKESTSSDGFIFDSTHLEPKFIFTEFNCTANFKLKFLSKTTVEIALKFVEINEERLFDDLLTPRINFELLLLHRELKKTSKIIRCVFGKFRRFINCNDAHTCVFNVAELEKYFVMDEPIDCKVSVERLIQTKKSTSENGELIWIVENYMKNKEYMKTNAILCTWGPCFYTSESGYRMQINLRTNKNDQRGVWFQILIINGRHDRVLKTWFPHHISITVTKKIKPPQVLTVKKEKDITLGDVDNYFIYLGNHAEVEKFLIKDALHCKIIIKEMTQEEKNLLENIKERKEKERLFKEKSKIKKELENEVQPQMGELAARLAVQNWKLDERQKSIYDKKENQ